MKYDDSNKSKITLGGEGGTTITNVKSALDGAKDEKGKDATIATATGDDLKNAANLGDLQKVYNDINTKAENASASHTALTVEGGTSAGTKDEKTKEDVYAGKNILLHESTDENGKVTYDLKLAKDISIGKPGKDGEDGKIGIDSKDGHIGLNGSDGITVRGLDGKDGTPGKDGVTITGPKGEAGKDGIDGKVGISGKDGKDAVSISGKDGVGHIGLTGPAGTNGKDGTNAIDITVKNGYDKAGQDGKDGINGKNGVDGTSLTRIVYKDGAGEHQVATMEDGLKFKGDNSPVIAKKLNNTLDIIGGADSKNLTEGNIGVNSTDKGQLKVQLAKDLTGITSISNQKTEGGKTTGAKITLGTDGNVDVNGGKITKVGSGIETDANGKYTVTDQNKGNAANIGDVQNMVNDAKTELISGDNGLNNKANIDASNIGANLKGEDGKTPASDDEKTTNENAWGKAIGTGKIEANNGQLVTGDTVYNEVRPKEDGNYVKTNQTTGANLSALDSKIGKLDDDGNYIKKDDSISKNLSTLDAQVKTNADNIANNTKSIQNITNSVKNLSDNAVQYDKDSNKTKVTLGGEGGTTITNVKDGALSEKSSDAVNGKQLYNEQKAREAADKDITEKVTNNTNEITKIKNGDFTDASKTAIHNIAKDAVKVVDGKNTTVTKVDGTDTTPTTYAVNVEGTGKVASGDTGLISGDTLYKEVHVDKDGSYIKGSQTVVQNLSALDSGLKTTSDLIHTNAKGDTIQIGGNSTATKIDVSGKDKDGNTTGRVITGVMTDGKDLTSAANVGYVNGITSANTQQIYRDMNNAYSRLDTNINRAAAGSNALAALHPLDFDPADKASFAVGYGHYHNANAAAVGAFYQPNANTMVNMGISLGNGDPGFNAGVSFKIGKGSAYNGVSKAEMAQTIHDQAEEISAIKANDAAKDKRIDALEKENQEMKKQIQEILSRLNG
ncbi:MULTISPECIES: YadA-like family protein [unclassified Megasphaera]|uniref:YadA-like family protein n=1 Tax=unclassified Megasphaera TaxID=2626256 RepID=UPI0025C39499|nr:YadA-like family protein [Megasphaera sp. UBA4233]